MERTTASMTMSRWQHQLAWRTVGIYLPILVLAVAAFLSLNNVRDRGGSPAPVAAVDPQHSERLNANIAFFEERVVETKDSLSYNRLTGLYLQRFREVGDPADIGRAELSARASLEAARNAYSGLVNLALVKVVQHDFAAAEQYASQARDQYPEFPDAYAILGDAQVALGKYAEATNSYVFYLDNAPGFAAYSRQAALAELKGNVALAEQFWRAAIGSQETVAPENAAWARVQLGNLYFATGRVSEANAEYAEGLRLFPDYGPAQAGIARVAAARGENERAIEYYTLATSRVPALEPAVALAEVYQRAGRSDEARQQFAIVKAITTLLASAGVRSDLPAILFELDHGTNLAAALESAQIAYAERPSVYGADVYAWALYRAGRFEEARVRSEDALRLGTQDPALYFHAGMIASALGDSVTARGHLERALALNPDFSVSQAPVARQTLESLKGGAR